MDSEANTSFVNDISRIGEAKKHSVMVSVIVLLSSFFVVLLPFWWSLDGHYGRNFVVGVTIVIGLISGGTGCFFGIKKLEKHFSSYQLEISEVSVSVQGHFGTISINRNQITKISENRNGDIFIRYGKLKKLGISRYIMNREKLLEELEKTTVVQKKSHFKSLLPLSPYIFFIAFQMVRIFPNKYYFIISGACFVVTACVSLVYMMLSDSKKAGTYFAVVIYGLFVFMVAKNVLAVITQL